MTSFRKRTVKKPIRGTRTSPHTAQVITSCGNPSLDTVFGGGLPLGSICLIEEDRFVTHAKVLAKYFLAEGVLCKHKIFLASLDDQPVEMLRRLPKPLTDEEAELEQHQEDLKANEQMAAAAPDKNGLRIAWRYNDLPLVNSEQAQAKIGHHFNLMENMDSMMFYYAQTTVWDDSCRELDIVVQDQDNSKSSSSSTSLEREQPPLPETAPPSEGSSLPNLVSSNNNNIADSSDDPWSVNATTDPELLVNNEAPPQTLVGLALPQQQPSQANGADFSHSFHNPRYGRLLNDLQELLRDKKFTSDMNNKQKNICRVCLTSLGSPLWYDDHFAEDLLKFLTVLRASVRSCASVCFITMPMHLIAKYSSTLVQEIRQLVDYSIELESFAGSERETHPAFKEYSGLLHLHKMTALNTLAVHMPETTDLAFKLRRKKFVIEKLHLPPELQESSGTNAAPIVDIMATNTATKMCSSNNLPINSKAASLDF